MIRSRHFILILLSFFASIGAMQAQDGIPDRPSPPHLVNILSKNSTILSPAEVTALEARLVEFGNATSNQICILIVDDLKGMEPNDYATRVIRTWKVGQEKLNNGIVILIKPKTGSENGQAYITTGYGLEGAIPDITCKKIMEHEMIPHFRQGQYADGINASVDVLMSLAKGEYNSDAYAKRVGRASGARSPNAVAIIVIIILGIFFLFIRGGGMGGGSGGGGFWIGGGGFGGGGGGGFGGGGGGGFGGFGGGSGGGGGAGGSW